MAGYVQLGAVRTWYDERGAGEPLLLLHPGGADARAWADEVTLEHASAMYRALPDAELAIVPGTSHGLLHEKPALCNTIVLDFPTGEPVRTFAPVRRAAGG